MIKVHPTQPPGKRSTDPADLRSEVTASALRDMEAVHRKVSVHGEHVGAYTAAPLKHPLPWTKMRQVYRLLGLVHRHGADRVNEACRRALEAEAVNVGLIDRMLTRGLDTSTPPTPNRPGGVARLSVIPTSSRSGGPHDHPRTRAVSTPKPIDVSAELKALMHRLKLDRLLDTLPERHALARQNHLPHHDFLEILLLPARFREQWISNQPALS